MNTKELVVADDIFDAELVEVLNDQEATRLAELEQVIGTGLETYILVGTALREVRDSRLYRTVATSFEVYCRDQWGMTGDWAHKLIDASGVARQLSSAGLPAPANEAQARAVGAVPEEHRTEVWTATVEATNGKPTAAAVSAVAEKLVPAAPSKATITSRANRAAKEADRVAAERKKVEKLARKADREATRARAAQLELAASGPELIREAIAGADPATPWERRGGHWPADAVVIPALLARALTAWVAGEAVFAESTRDERYPFLGALLAAWLPLGSDQLTVRCSALGGARHDAPLGGIAWMEARDAAIVRSLAD